MHLLTTLLLFPIAALTTTTPTSSAAASTNLAHPRGIGSKINSVLNPTPPNLLAALPSCVRLCAGVVLINETFRACTPSPAVEKQPAAQQGRALQKQLDCYCADGGRVWGDAMAQLIADMQTDNTTSASAATVRECKFDAGDLAKVCDAVADLSKLDDADVGKRNETLTAISDMVEEGWTTVLQEGIHDIKKDLDDKLESGAVGGGVAGRGVGGAAVLALVVGWAVAMM